MSNVTLLTDEERLQLPMVISRRKRFQKLIKTSISNYSTLFSNCLMISGKPGSGKTTLVVGYLDNLQSMGLIAGYRRASGHVTPSSLFNLLKATAEPIDGLPQILVLDDVDCMKDPGCLELMKAAFDTKSSLSTNRDIHYRVDGTANSVFKYQGFGIIITNDNFLDMENSIHLQAVIDRVQAVTCDLEPKDMEIFTTSLIEKYLNENEDNLTQDEIDSIVELFNTDIRRWMALDAFKKAKVPYSLRLIKKFIDAQRSYREDWKDFNMSYTRLQSTCDAIVLSSAVNTNSSDVDPEVHARPLRTRRTNNLPPLNANGKYYDPNTGIEYSSSMQSYYKKKAQAITA